MTSPARLTLWASVPPTLWLLFTGIGFVTSQALCDNPVVLHLVGAGLVAMSVTASFRTMAARSDVEREGSGFPGLTAVIVAVLFTIGIGITWGLVGVGMCI